MQRPGALEAAGPLRVGRCYSVIAWYTVLRHSRRMS